MLVGELKGDSTTTPPLSSLDAAEAFGVGTSIPSAALYRSLLIIPCFSTSVLEPSSSSTFELKLSSSPTSVSSDYILAATSCSSLMTAAISVPLLVTAHPLTANRSTGATL
ncbi:hypothetical protein Bca4012_036460 [Brassica carinata]